MSNKLKSEYILSFIVVCIATLINVHTFNIRFGDEYNFSESNYLSKSERGAESRYYYLAEAISKGKGKYLFKGYETEMDDIGRFVVPGYSALIAFNFWLPGSTVLNIFIFQILLYVLACVCIYTIGRTWLNKWIAFFLALWFIAYAELAMYTVQIVRDGISGSILVFALYFLSQYLSKYKSRDLYFYTIVMVVLIAVNSRFIVHFGFIGIFLFIIALGSKGEIKLKHVIVSGALVILAMMPWHIRQYMVYEKPIIFTPVRTAQIFKTKDLDRFKRKKADGKFFSYEEITTKHFWFHVDTTVFTHEKYEQLKMNYNAFTGANKYLSRLSGFFELYRSDYGFGYGGDVRLYPPNFVETRVFILGPMLFLMFVGGFYSVRKRNLFFMAVTLCIIAHILLHMYIHYYWRYRLPITPAIFLLGWYGIQQIINQLPIKWLSPFKREDAT